MIILCNNNDTIDRTLDYVKEYRKSAPYLYANLMRYRNTNENIRTWIDIEDQEIKGVFLLYYTCLHFISHEAQYPSDRVYTMIQEHNPSVIMLPESLGIQLENKLEADYSVEHNHIMNFDSSSHSLFSPRVTIAERIDLNEIVKLMMEDEEYYAVYTTAELLKQLTDRYDSNFSRFFIIRMKENIVAVISTYAEVADFAVIGGLVVHPSVRRQGIGAELIKHSYYTLASENFTVIDFVNFNNHASFDMHKKMCVHPISALYKFVQK